MANATKWILPSILQSGNQARAIAALTKYFDVDITGVPHFTGSRFERFGGGGDRVEVANLITTEDLVAVTMLSVNVPAPAALRLLADTSDQNQREIAELLGRLPIDLELSEANDEQLDNAKQPLDRRAPWLRSWAHDDQQASRPKATKATTGY